MGTPLTIKKWPKPETAHQKSLASRLATQKMCSKSPIYSYWLSPISLCLYRIRSFIVVGHKIFYVSFKNATIDFMIIIVKTLFLYNITRMPYFVASDELTLATFVFEPETFLRCFLFVILFTCIVIHWTHYLFSDWPKAYSEFSKSAPGTTSSCRLYNNHVKDTQDHG